jgi:nicotinate (nicotinamide) nucleotide adenylyltransferase
MSATAIQKRIGILGAAFDPPHFGHLLLAQLAINTNELDEIWLIPSPERWDKKPVASNAVRFAWLTQALSLCPEQFRKHMRVSDVELKLPTYRGTYWLLEELRRQNKNCSFSLVLGWDSFVGIPQWRDPTTGTINGAQLLADTRCYVSPRANSDLAEPVKHPSPHAGGVVMLPALDAPEAGDISWMGGTTLIQVAALSSSLIRSALKSGTELQFMFPELQKEIVKSKVY